MKPKETAKSIFECIFHNSFLKEYTEISIISAIKCGIEEERERCVRVIKEFYHKSYKFDLSELVKKIRGID